MAGLGWLVGIVLWVAAGIDFAYGGSLGRDLAVCGVGAVFVVCAKLNDVGRS